MFRLGILPWRHKVQRKLMWQESSINECSLLHWLLLWMEKLYHFKQLIKEKPRANNPADFSLIANIKHHSNTQKVLKHLEETVISYVGTEKKRKTCSICTFNMGRFSRSKTDEVTLLLRENMFPNMFQICSKWYACRFPSPRFTANNWVKGIMNDKFNKWFAETLRKEQDSGKYLNEISTKYKLTTMKLLYAQ